MASTHVTFKPDLECVSKNVLGDNKNNQLAKSIDK